MKFFTAAVIVAALAYAMAFFRVEGSGIVCMVSAVLFTLSSAS